MCHAAWSQHADTFRVKGNLPSFTPHLSTLCHSHFQRVSSRKANERPGLTHNHKNHNLLSKTKFPFFFSFKKKKKVFLCVRSSDHSYKSSVFVAPGSGDQFMLDWVFYCSVGVGSPLTPPTKRLQRVVALTSTSKKLSNSFFFVIFHPSGVTSFIPTLWLQSALMEEVFRSFT